MKIYLLFGQEKELLMDSYNLLFQTCFGINTYYEFLHSAYLVNGHKNDICLYITIPFDFSIISFGNFYVTVPLKICFKL